MVPAAEAARKMNRSICAVCAGFDDVVLDLALAVIGFRLLARRDDEKALVAVDQDFDARLDLADQPLDADHRRQIK